VQRILILVIVFFTSNRLCCQRCEDFVLIASKKMDNSELIVNSNISPDNLKKESTLTMILKSPILFYREFISSQMKPRCYFYPSCSQFTVEAIQKYGIKGFFLGIDRIMRCNVFSEDKYPCYKSTNRLYDPVSSY